MRLCECGCGEQLRGPNSKRFINDSHRKRAARSSATKRLGLEAFLGVATDLPASLVEAARALADAVDANPDDSPLWGRYTAILDDLHESSSTRDGETSVEHVDFLAQLQTVETAETYRAKRYNAATTDDERARWVRLVPIGCAEGSHRVKKWPGGNASCLDCGIAAA
jgi:hypothetical protein